MLVAETVDFRVMLSGEHVSEASFAAPTHAQAVHCASVTTDQPPGRPPP